MWLLHHLSAFPFSATSQHISQIGVPERVNMPLSKVSGRVVDEQRGQ